MSVVIFSQDKIEMLEREAAQSPRLRAHLSLHDSHQDAVQRVVIALINGTYIPPHYHELSRQWEHFQIIKGEIDLLVFDHEGCLVNQVSLGGESGNIFVQIPPLVPHTLVCRSPSAIVMEIKEGPFDERYAKIIPSWSYAEDYSTIPREAIINSITRLDVGQKLSMQL